MNVFAAEEYDSANIDVSIDDHGELLTTEEEIELEDWVKDRYGQVPYHVLFLTTEDAEGKNTMTYSDDYMDQRFPNSENNIAFVIDMDNREIYINTMGMAITYINDREIDAALDRGYNRIVRDDYYGCLQEMAEYCLEELTDASTLGFGSPRNFWGDFFRNMISLPVMGISLVITAIILFVLVAQHKKANQVIDAGRYEQKENYEIIDKKEHFIRSYTNVIKDYYAPKSSSSHSSSSGRSHGGGGRSF
jgi:uncharacterized protein